MSKLIRDLGDLHCSVECNEKEYIILGGVESRRYRIDIVEHNGFDYKIVYTKGYNDYNELTNDYKYMKKNLEEYVWIRY